MQRSRSCGRKQVGGVGTGKREVLERGLWVLESTAHTYEPCFGRTV